MREKLPLVLSIAALVVAVLGSTPVGRAAADALPIARYARNADKVDGIHASRTPRAGRLLALGANRRFPARVVPPGPIGPQGPAGPAGPAGAAGPQGGPGISGLEVVVAQSAFDSNPLKSATATCPAGKRALGGGTDIGAQSVPNPIGVGQDRPLGSPPSAWIGGWEEESAYAGLWQVRTWAVCANVAG